MVFGDFHTAKKKLQNERFDCILYLNVLHLVRDPIEVLSLFRELQSTGSAVIVQLRICYGGESSGENFVVRRVFKISGIMVSKCAFHHPREGSSLVSQCRV